MKILIWQVNDRDGALDGPKIDSLVILKRKSERIMI